MIPFALHPCKHVSTPSPLHPSTRPRVHASTRPSVRPFTPPPLYVSTRPRVHGFNPKWIPKGKPLGYILPTRSQNCVSDLYIIRFKPPPVSIKLVSSKRGFFQESAWGVFCRLDPKPIFPDPWIVHIRPIPISNKMVSSKRMSLRESPWDVFCPLGPKTEFLI